MLACDFLTVETIFLQRIYVLFFWNSEQATTRCQRQPELKLSALKRVNGA
jgi:hypothetical protein